MSTRSVLYALARFLGDVRAVRRGRIRQRIERRLLGKVFGQIIRLLTRR